MNISLKNSYLNLPEIFYEKSKPRKVKNPQLVIFNESLAKELGEEIIGLKDNVDFLVGNNLNTSIEPISLAYAGHQFGHFTMLGDGRAHLLGQYITTNETWDLQLKGSGRTLYSRGGDGLASLGPMIREYIISESLYHLGVPTTRSLSVVKTGDFVQRQTYEEGAVLLRLAKSHIRVGTFEYAKYFGGEEVLKNLADFVIDEDVDKEEILEASNPYIKLLEIVIRRQALLIAQWVSLGLIHGVMNTDNMLISGESIDFGPIAFMDIYNPDTVFSSIDRYGRYSYKNQTNIGLWNLYRFASTLLALFDEDQVKAEEMAKESLNRYEDIFEKEYYEIMLNRIGLKHIDDEKRVLIDNFLEILNEKSLDYHNSFLYLIENFSNTNPIDEFSNWIRPWKAHLDSEGMSHDDILSLMKSSNPAIIPRNTAVEKTIRMAEQGDYDLLYKLMDLLKNPYSHREEQIKFMKEATPTTSGTYKTFCGT